MEINFWRKRVKKWKSFKTKKQWGSSGIELNSSGRRKNGTPAGPRMSGTPAGPKGE